MIFNSLVFLVFFAVVYAAYRALPHRGQNWLLLAARYVFYGWWDWRFAGLLAATSFSSWGSGLLFVEEKCIAVMPADAGAADWLDRLWNLGRAGKDLMASECQC